VYSRLLPVRALCRRADGIREERELLPPLEAAAPLRAHRAPPIRVGHQQEPPVAGCVRQLREAAERAAPAPALGGREGHEAKHPPAVRPAKVFSPPRTPRVSLLVAPGGRRGRRGRSSRRGGGLVAAPGGG